MELTPIHKPLFKSIDEQNIEILVREFYTRVLQDTILAPFFILKLGENIQSDTWEEHLLVLIEFWKKQALGYGHYDASPLQPHFNIEGLTLEAFEIWLKTFHTTIDSLYTISAGKFFKDKSTDIAENFIRRLQLK